MIRRVACAVSGGVDSAVSAYLLKAKGFDVTGVFMKNWEILDEDYNCSFSEDLESAKTICGKLKIPLIEINFVKEYWPLLECYKIGWTPNPDVLCNRFVKFEKLYNSFIKNPKYKFDAFATGHYAQNSLGNYLEHSQLNVDPQLIRSVDPVKDQTFWLCTIQSKHLKYCMFPIGNLKKPQVKQIAKDAGLHNVSARKERSFKDFIDQYISEKRGLLIDIETKKVLGEHLGIHHYTLGQRVPVMRAQGPYYVAHMDPCDQNIYIAKHTNNTHLFMDSCTTGRSIWISDRAPRLPSSGILFQWQNKWRPIASTVRQHDNKSKNYVSPTIKSSIRDGPQLQIDLAVPMRCVAPGQWAALYDGKVCLGGAQIHTSKSLAEKGIFGAYEKWKVSDMEINYQDDDVNAGRIEVMK